MSFLVGFFLSFMSICLSAQASVLINSNRSELANVVRLATKSLSLIRNLSTSSNEGIKEVQTPNEPRKTVRILSIAGGGIRGIIPLYILRYLEETVGRPISKQFDVIAGSSTGGIMALALNIRKEISEPRYSAHELIDLYVEDCRRIFDKGQGSPSVEENRMYYEAIKDTLNKREGFISSIDNMEKVLREGIRTNNILYSTISPKQISGIIKENFNSTPEEVTRTIQGIKNLLQHAQPYLEQLSVRDNLFSSSHSAKGLESIRSRFEEAKLSECLSTVLVPAYNISGSAYLFNSHKAKMSPDHNFKMGDVAMATSAAPTYFPPAEIFNLREEKHKKPYRFVDGSVVANNPSLYALATARRLFPQANDFYLLSLGCGEGPAFEIRKDAIAAGGLLKWSPYIITMLMNASNDYTRGVTEILMEEARRVNIAAPRNISLSPNDLQAEIANNLDKTEPEDLHSIKEAAQRFLEKPLTLEAIANITKELKIRRDYATSSEGYILNPEKDLQ